MNKRLRALLLTGCLMSYSPPTLVAEEPPFSDAVRAYTSFADVTARGGLLLSSGNVLVWGDKEVRGDNRTGDFGWIAEVSPDAREVYSLTLEYDNPDTSIQVVGAAEHDRGILVLTRDGWSLEPILFCLDTKGNILKKVSFEKDIAIDTTSPAGEGLFVAGWRVAAQRGEDVTTPWAALINGEGKIAWEYRGTSPDAADPTADAYFSLCAAFEKSITCVRHNEIGSRNIHEIHLATFDLQGTLVSQKKIEPMGSFLNKTYRGILLGEANALLFGGRLVDAYSHANATSVSSGGRTRWDHIYDPFTIFKSAVFLPDGYLIAANAPYASSTDLLTIDANGKLIKVTNIRNRNLSGNLGDEAVALLYDGQTGDYWLIINSRTHTASHHALVLALDPEVFDLGQTQGTIL